MALVLKPLGIYFGAAPEDIVLPAGFVVVTGEAEFLEVRKEQTGELFLVSLDDRNVVVKLYRILEPGVRYDLDNPIEVVQEEEL